MAAVPEVSPLWLLSLINDYAPEPRRSAGNLGQPYPDLFAEEAGRSLPRPSPPDLVDIAGRLWAVFAAPAPGDRAEMFNDLLESAALSPCVGADGRLGWWTGQRSSRGLLLAGCLVRLLAAVEAGGWQSLGVCAAADCADAYLDPGGRAARRYCSHTCLNRSRVRAYRSRRRAGQEGSSAGGRVQG